MAIVGCFRVRSHQYLEFLPDVLDASVRIISSQKVRFHPGWDVPRSSFLNGLPPCSILESSLTSTNSILIFLSQEGGMKQVKLFQWGWGMPRVAQPGGSRQSSVAKWVGVTLAIVGGWGGEISEHGLIYFGVTRNEMGWYPTEIAFDLSNWHTRMTGYWIYSISTSVKFLRVQEPVRISLLN